MAVYMEDSATVQNWVLQFFLGQNFELRAENLIFAFKSMNQIIFKCWRHTCRETSRNYFDFLLLLREGHWRTWLHINDWSCSHECNNIEVSVSYFNIKFINLLLYLSFIRFILDLWLGEVRSGENKQNKILTRLAMSRACLIKCWVLAFTSSCVNTLVISIDALFCLWFTFFLSNLICECVKFSRSTPLPYSSFRQAYM